MKASKGHLSRSAVPLLISGLVGSIFAVSLGLMSPGNTLRQTLYPPHPSWPTLLKFSFAETFHFIGASTRSKAPLSLSVSLLLPALIAFISPAQELYRQISIRRAALFLALLLLLAFALIFFCFMPSIYATSFPPDARV